MSLSFRASAWEYDTSSASGFAFGPFAGALGNIKVLSPAAEKVSLNYAGGGAGASLLRIKFPPIDKIFNVKGKAFGPFGADERWPSYGKILIAESIVGRDLTISDFKGPCVSVEASGGIVMGWSGIIMLFGLDPAWLAIVTASATSPAAMSIAMEKLLASVRGAFLMTGLSVSIQAGAGVAGVVGIIYQGPIPG